MAIGGESTGITQAGAADLATGLWRALLPDVEPPRLAIEGSETHLPSVFRIERLAGATIGAAHMSASAFRALSLGRASEAVTLDLRDAALAFCSEQYLRIDGEAPEAWAPLSGDYRAKDRRYVRLHCNFEHHAAAAARALGCEQTKEAFTRAVLESNAFDVENAVVREGGASGADRTRTEWEAEAHYEAVRSQPLIDFARYGDAPPVQRSRPLRVLDLTRVIAGPLASKVLAAYGAEVLHVASHALPTIPAADIDHGFGKHTCDLDIRSAGDAETLRALIRGADVLVESYRPGALERHGFGFGDVIALQPEIIYVSLSAYGQLGSWGGRRGFDSVVQMTSGIASAQNDTDKPRPLPCQALDHGTGYLAAFAAMAAAIRRASEGGAWRANVSLARTAEFLWDLGLDNHLEVEKPNADALSSILRSRNTPAGVVQYVPVPGRIGDSSFDAISSPDVRLVSPRWLQ